MNTFRPAAYPLITVDPYFSVWSCSDTLDETYTKHWTGRPAPIYLAVAIGDEIYKVCDFDVNFVNRAQHSGRLPQTNVEVTPLSTVYTFENNRLKLTVDFTTPLLMDRLDIMTRPVSYIEYNVEIKNGKADNVRLIFGISSECCVDNSRRQIEFKRTGYSLCCGNTVQNPLATSGDSVLIDWGYLHLCDTSAYAMTVEPDEKIDITTTYNPYAEKPYLMVERNEASGVIVVAYEEIKAIEYFGEQIDEYYTKYFQGFGEMISAAKSEYHEIKQMCRDFDEKLMGEAEKYGEHYKNIIALAYRQAIAAHKLIEDKDGKIIFLSKECHSNGCIGTLDVTYPSIPMFLKYNPELVFGMLRPIIKYAQSDDWKFEFTPHDVGRYPIANGQVYGKNNRDKQMPVEEAGNMLLCVAAACRYSNDKGFFDENREILKSWTDYLVEFGYDPGNQLCTDDFAGHLNHNCNLSIKAILGIAAYGDLSGDNSYMDIAKEYAKKWEIDAKAKRGTRLTFDKEDSWSLKYNIVWDNILGYHIFSDDMKKAEIELYMSKMNRYGVPLDSRADYTKLDWLMWSTCIYDNKEYFEAVTESIINMINETYDRVPMTDWYDTKNALHHSFRNRTVVGGLFINML
ncbi:MAG: DUF4965 domain-containing protein [Clostridia bacterium]|nr:DUF4965 domain-containing protein [Clostridia bacterium]